ncbi:MAG: hypothetical protein AAB354_12200 [candidate division KSB1 bacterium]
MHDLDRTTAEFEADQEYYESDGEMEFAGEYYEGEILSEADEMELAAELLEVASEEELDQFFGKVFRKVAGAVGRAAKSSIGRKIIGGLKGIAKKALPIAGKALGSVVGGPIGGAIGGKLGSFASNLFEAEFEGMSYEDQEFEVARRLVRLSAEAAGNAARMPATQNPQIAANQAMTAAAQRHAPGLLRQKYGAGATGGSASGSRSGRWVRRGRKIIIYGA